MDLKPPPPLSQPPTKKKQTYIITARSQRIQTQIPACAIIEIYIYLHTFRKLVYERLKKRGRARARVQFLMFLMHHGWKLWTMCASFNGGGGVLKPPPKNENLVSSVDFQSVTKRFRMLFFFATPTVCCNKQWRFRLQRSYIKITERPVSFLFLSLFWYIGVENGFPLLELSL